MAKVIRNSIVQGISGKVGALVFRQMPDGSTYVSGKPDFSHRKFSEAQLEQQNRFWRAKTYAKQASKTEPIYQELAEGTVLSAYNIALSDWFKPPVIHSIEREGGRIRVEASDNVMGTKVVISILDVEGKVLEKGDALQISERLWEFATTQDGKIAAEAWDLAGNVTIQTEE